MRDGLSNSAEIYQEIYQDRMQAFNAHEKTWLRLAKTQRLVKRTRDKNLEDTHAAKEKIRKLEEGWESYNFVNFQVELCAKTYLPVQNSTDLLQKMLKCVSV